METAGVTRSPAFTAEDVARFYANGWWTAATISDAVRANAIHTPDRTAYVDHPNRSLTWREFDSAATALAGELAVMDVRPGTGSRCGTATPRQSTCCSSRSSGAARWWSASAHVRESAR
ncbi:hypothetical protein MAUB_47740 [Mycolicibacterium aubagnense]|uniref:Uncharacterized protein n=2 Tax=Mycolicibacterium aubagnense TaxID=319707 RepID=A0ABM7IJH9_9MYCO|nr:hypothetical protein MAUB_47740 [Mycolicibacterium aubagnense]